MDTKNNYDRARQVINSWPAWKREYQLTKTYSDEQKNRDKHQQVDKKLKEHVV